MAEFEEWRNMMAEFEEWRNCDNQEKQFLKFLLIVLVCVLILLMFGLIL